jgi:hypothetical protein
MNVTFKAKSGMSLVEILISALVLLLLIGGLTTSVVFALRLNYTNTQQYAAFSLCKEQVEYLNDVIYSNRIQKVRGFTLTGGKYVMVENNLPLNVQGYSGQYSITGTRRTEVTDYTTPSGHSYTNTPHLLVNVSFTWQARTKLAAGAPLTTQTADVWSRMYPRRYSARDE